MKKRQRGCEHSPWWPMAETMEENMTKCCSSGRPSDSACRFQAPAALGLIALFQLLPSCTAGKAIHSPFPHVFTLCHSQ